MTGVIALRVRVCVMDVWDTVELSLPPESTVAGLKAAALARLGVPDGAPFIVLPARRQPVR